MAIVNALRFDDRSGAMVTDEESWHLRRRKTYFRPILYELRGKGAGAVCASLGGVGDPNYHHEVILRVRRVVARDKPSSMEDLGGKVLDAMHETTRRIADDRLRFLFGFTVDDLNRGRFSSGEEDFELKNPAILKRAREIVEGREALAGRDLVPPNQACLMGTDADGSFSMFCLKESDGVLSFNAGGFESLGAGRYAGGMRLGSGLGERTLEARRNGFKRSEGMLLLLDSVLDASDHFGMVGGLLHVVLADGGLIEPRRIRGLDDDRAHLATDVARARRGGFLAEDDALALLDGVVFGDANLAGAQRRLFKKSAGARDLELYLRGYKVGRA